MYKASKNTPLKTWQVWFNKGYPGRAARWSKSSVFSNAPGAWPAPATAGEARNATHFPILATAWNLHRNLNLA